MRALVVDDSRAIRTILGRMLRELGFEVFEAGGGRAALEVLAAHGAVEVALVDWNMPEMDGIQLVRALRADPRLASMRIMMVTTETEIEKVILALDSGANEYLMKPFTTEAVAEKLALLGLGVPA
jgi:two-component system chemotaxis response regulator CheY